ncbi:hypothetical protein B4U45_00635 [Mycobacterium persicum]|uniref:Uncharacterized protein n=1 Tax=Mycobacterium persicum TaxID=1487726 RepID=A0A8E2LKN2_9MYCO|nr:hypothetical protein [Mycobacterium persicum]KZS84559.1 hypothetical protein A4G31_00355 [Mycobacterium persicum]ORB54503.1 hypothetical protein BST40_07065 [Mycobacterium persicum]ORB93325.1 hypothetical protein B1T44_00635 [Mycobacterium persicum]ORC05406.1 hypothetical protein B4U45_00635 [Mycobacterium persicum]VAZ75866.1 hypothetical protein LAUMK15_03050 [Mycobacterium persicum]
MTEMKGVPMGNDNGYSEVDVRTAERIADAPLPTGAKLRMRQNLPVQFWRFARINLKMMRIIFSRHD